MAEELTRLRPTAEVRSLPIADGGEGTLDCLAAAAGGELHTVTVSGPYREPVTAQLLFLDGGRAVIETAQCAGLPLVGERRDPELTTTYGVGELIRFAAEQGAKEIILTLGGSCTNDCGAGMLSALGVRFTDSDGREFVPTGKTLKDVVGISAEGLEPLLKELTFTAMCDVKNPLCGADGCAAVFARQKGADDAMIARLEEGASHFAGRAAAFLGVDLSREEGVGAAGGLGFGCRVFLGASLRSGIGTVLALCDYDRLAAEAELIITGEGRLDRQSLMGKVIGGVISHSGKTPVAVLCGQYLPFDTEGCPTLRYILPISEGQELAYALCHGEENLRAGTRALIGLLERDGL